MTSTSDKITTGAKELVTQAKEYVTEKKEDAKEKVGELKDTVKEKFGYNTFPQANVEHHKAYLNDIVRGNWKLNHVTKPEDTSTRSYLPTNFTQDFVSEASGMFSSKWENIRDTLGYSDTYPQANVQHKHPYLNDIANGNWKKLKHVPTTKESNFPVINFSLDSAKEYFTTKWSDVKEAFGFGSYPQANVRHTYPWMNDIAKGNWKLKHVTTTTERNLPIVGLSTQELIDDVKDFLALKWEDVKSALRYEDPHPQAKVKHDKEFMNDIAKGNWDLHHVTGTHEETLPVVGVPAEYNWGKENVRIKKIDRSPFLCEVKDGTTLRHVENMHDRSAPVITEGIHIKKTDDHKQLLLEVTDFAKHPELQHVQTVDKSKPAIDENIKLNKMEQKHSLLENLREVFTSGRSGTS